MNRLTHKHLVKASDSYMKLIRRFPLRPIRSASEYDLAAVIIDELAIRGEKDLDRGESDYLAILSDLIEAYDDEHYLIPDDLRPGHEKLKSLISENGSSMPDLARILGVGRSLVSLLLAGKRRITADHAKALGTHFKLEPGYFLS